MKFPFFIFIYQVNALQECKPDNASFHPLRSTTNIRLVFSRPPPQAETCPYGPDARLRLLRLPKSIRF